MHAGTCALWYISAVGMAVHRLLLSCPLLVFPLTIRDWITLILSLLFETFGRKKKQKNQGERKQGDGMEMRMKLGER